MTHDEMIKQLRKVMDSALSPGCKLQFGESRAAKRNGAELTQLTVSVSGAAQNSAASLDVVAILQSLAKHICHDMFTRAVELHGPPKNELVICGRTDDRVYELVIRLR